MLLHLSLLIFGIALTTNIWIQQHTIASVIIETTAAGAVLYMFTVVALLKPPGCPFHPPVSVVLKHTLPRVTPMSKPESMEDFLDLIDALSFVEDERLLQLQ